MRRPLRPLSYSLLGLLLCIACGGSDDTQHAHPQTDSVAADGHAERDAPTPSGARPAPNHRVVYVPAYSHLFEREGQRTMLGVTLSVHNIDWNATIQLDQVDYFDTHGRLVRHYLKQPKELKPLATAEFKVSALDDEGGSGANFLLEWSGPDGARSPLAETIMVGKASGGYLSFTSRGVELTDVEFQSGKQPISPTNDGTQ